MSFPITCTACHKTFTISDEIFEKKVSGRVVTIKCKSCSQGIRVDGTKGAAKSSAPPPEAAPAPPAEPVWAVDYPDGQDREFSTAEVIAELEKGSISGTTLVWRDGMAEWLELHQVPELAPALAQLEAKKKAATAAKLAAAKAAPATVHKPRAPMPTVTGLGGSPALTPAPTPQIKETQPSTPDAVTPKAPAAEATKPRAQQASSPQLGKARPAQASTPELAKPRVALGSSPEIAKPRVALGSSPEIAKPRVALGSSPEIPKRAPLGSSPEIPKPRAAQPSAPQITPRPPLGSAPQITPRPPLGSAPELRKPPAAAPAPAAAAPAPAAPPPPPPPVAAAPTPPPNPFAAAPQAAPPTPFIVQPDPTPPLPASVAKVVSKPPQVVPAFPASPAAATPFGPAAAVAAPHASVEWPEAKKKTPLVIGGVVGAAVIIGGAVFALSSKDPPPPPPAPIAALPATPAPTTSPSPTPHTEAAAQPGSETASGSDPIMAPPDRGATPGAGFAELFAAGARKAESKGASVGPNERFDAAATKAPLAKAATEAQACKQSGGPTGKVTVVVTFEPSGKVSSATITDAPFAGSATATCISQTFKRAAIAPFSGLPGTVSKAFSIL